ncbi:MAG: purine-nucleoside phosphorylase [Coriobacteriia bacterium]|nr:purine-nucleoside phosphorylase [Coriobacteriia bacterium]
MGAEYGVDVLYSDARAAAGALAKASGGITPRVFVILGSGLGPVADELDSGVSLPFAQVPGLPLTKVAGHAGRFVFGHVGPVPVLAMQGRLHLYEGYPASQVVLPVRAARLLGCESLVVTNASGGVNPAYRSGDIMLIEDHLNLMHTNPLIGENLDAMGPRFPVMADAYTPELRAIALEVAATAGVPLRRGVYAGLCGPTYETVAEARMLRMLGADVAGMSTVPEVIAAVHAGMQVLGLSLVTNVAAGDEGGHENVVATSAAAAPRVAQLVTGVLARL